MFFNDKTTTNKSEMVVFFILTILSILVVALDLFTIKFDLLGTIITSPATGWSDILESSLEGWQIFVLSGNIFAIFHIFTTFILTSLEKITTTFINMLVSAYFVLNILTFSVFYANSRSDLDSTFPGFEDQVSLGLKGGLVTQTICMSLSFVYLVWAFILKKD